MKEDIYRHIGRRIREERLRRGWTQEQLAEKAEVHLSFVGQMERGVKKPSLKTVKAVADALGVKAGELFEEAPTRSSPYPLERKLADLIGDRSPAERQMLYETLRQLARSTRKLAKR